MPISDRLTTKLVSRARLLALAPATCLLLAQPTFGQASALAQAELQRRANNATEAQELLKKGDESYEAGKWSAAVAAYTGARELLPDAPATAALRKAATERLVQASVELARQQRRHGDVKGAGDTVDKVLDDEVAPDSALALEMREQLDDPIRTNPAVTKEDAADVEEVRQTLYRAEGFYNLGDFDEAARVYEDVLRTDPYNKAARRGMEQVSQQRADYARAAYDQTRAEMLGQVDEAWQLRVTPNEVIPADLEPGGVGADGTVLVTQKLEKIIIPVIDFDEVSIQDAYDFLRQQSIELDTLELDPDRRGVNFVLELGNEESARAIKGIRITLQLKQVPLGRVIQYLSDITRTIAVPHEWAVAIRPAGAVSTDMLTRTYRVPPDFLTSGGSAGNADEGGGDPFGDAPSEGLLARRLSAEEVLTQQGIPFPDGASASFNAGDSTLRVRNTVSNLAIVEQLVESLSSAEPTMVMVEVRMVRTQDRVLEELGFDWLLSEFSLGGSGLTPGVQAGTLTGGTSNPANLADVALPPGEFFRRGITSGNRSGDEAILGDGIDELILEQQQGFARGTARAPGILWANGIINNTNLTMLMRGLSQKKNVDLVVSPSTVTRSGQQSTIEVVREFIYPEEYEPPELPNTIGSTEFIDLDEGTIDVSTPLVPITPSTPTSFTTREDVGVVLDVLPTVSADKHYVDIALKPKVTDFDGFINYGTPITSEAPSTAIGDALGSLLGQNQRVELTKNEILMPVFSVMSAETNLTVADGTTLVIGGMLQSKLQKVQDKTQLLGDIPVVGRLFQNEAYAPIRTAVVFFVTVKVVDPSGRPYRDR